MPLKDDNFIDFDSEINRHQTNGLSHWDQFERIQFVTFRLADSLPQDLIYNTRLVIEQFKLSHPGEWSDTTIREYHNLIDKSIENKLDVGVGSCLLRQPEIRKIIADTLNHYNGINYQLYAYVIMPNHIHLLFKPLLDNGCKDIIQRIKSYTSTQINRMRGKTGRLWQKGYFDRMPRSKANFAHFLDYIQQNPKHLNQGEYSLYFDYNLIDQIL